LSSANWTCSGRWAMGGEDSGRERCVERMGERVENTAIWMRAGVDGKNEGSDLGD
jgi:hypothetical protein